MVVTTRYIKVDLEGVPSQDQEEIERFISETPNKITPLVKNNEVVTLQARSGNKYYMELVNGVITVTRLDRIEETKDLSVTLISDEF
jgi:hypothetical protein